jgi:hypothetical protein
MPRNVSGPSIQYFCISDHHQQVEGIRALLFVLDWVIRIAEMQITKLVSGGSTYKASLPGTLIVDVLIL